jgi:hypothetical protein
MIAIHRHSISVAFVAGLIAASPSLSPAQQPARTPPIKHVFVIMLENEGYDTTFAKHSRAPYLADTLRKAGALLHDYYGIGHFSLDNYLAIISGVPPTTKTQIDCPRFDDFVETGTAPDGQPIGAGCVYPAHVQTIANQLEANGLTWTGYMEDMGNDRTREAAACGHPAIGALDSTQRATAVDQYATKHDPFVYFHAIIDSPTCKRNVVPLPGLEAALRSVSTTSNLTFITPSLCHDGHDRPCVNGEPGSLESVNLFLQHWVPMIMSSPAYRADGLIVIAFDEALSIDATACCKEPSGPNVINPGVNGPGGGRMGAVLLSPFIKPGTVSTSGYNHYSLLKSLEDVFGLSYLGYAGTPGLESFGKDVYTKYKAPK